MGKQIFGKYFARIFISRIAKFAKSAAGNASISPLIFCAGVALFAFCAHSARAENPPNTEMPRAKYVFLFIGDGMSLPQRMATETFLRTQNAEGLAMNSFENQAVTYTHSANSLITDSAAGGTAIACGTKTNNGTLGLDSDGNKIESIAAVAKRHGKKVGIISSVMLNHATPAAFYAHREKRADYYSIGIDLLDSDFDFFGGGGFADENDEKSPLWRGNLYALAEKSGYKIVRSEDGLAELKCDGTKVLAIGAKSAFPLKIDNPKFPSLSVFLEKAIEVLDGERGFFIMLEGGEIDWTCHTNDAGAMLEEMFDFDKSIKSAVAFAKKHPDETLIVVTADHETGGLTLGNGSAKYIKSANFSNSKYSMPISRLSYQKSSMEAFRNGLNALAKEKAKLSFDDVKPKIEKTFGLMFSGATPMTLSKSEIDDLEDSFEIKKGKISSKFYEKILKIFSGRAGLSWTGHGHTGLPVISSAYGKGAEAFRGFIDNTEIGNLLKQSVR